MNQKFYEQVQLGRNKSRWQFKIKRQKKGNILTNFLSSLHQEFR
jgi:hypothetical protein